MREAYENHVRASKNEGIEPLPASDFGLSDDRPTGFPSRYAFADVEFASLTDGMQAWMTRQGITGPDRCLKVHIQACMDALHIPCTTDNIVAWLDACNPIVYRPEPLPDMATCERCGQPYPLGTDCHNHYSE
jgi:hypothetical protein